jgi:CARDB
MRTLAVAAVAVLAAPGAAAARPAHAVLAGCDSEADAGTFDGRMDAVEGTERMAMSFVLQVRRPGRQWQRVRLPGFAAWHTSVPGRQRYVYTKRVEGLVGPARYRVAVRFRWLDAAGDVVRSMRAVSRACRIPDPRPDLGVAGLAVRRDRAHFAVTVRNSGRSEAGPSRVELDLGDAGAPLSAPVGPLAAGGRQTVVLSGRACTSGAVLTATADATDAVEERDEGDDVLVASCP